MKRCIELILILILTSVGTNSFAGCNCDDWMNRGGYCVDYVKAKIPTFPIPKTDTEIEALKNKAISSVEEGDVAIFDLGRYWHVAYVEKVHTDSQGRATSIDVSEKNFGGQISYDEYQDRWHTTSEREWRRALCCGVTNRYNQRGYRRNISIGSVEQIWDPDIAATQKTIGGDRDGTVLDKVRETLNHLIQFTGRKL
jgi:hypothetical protein